MEQQCRWVNIDWYLHSKHLHANSILVSMKYIVRLYRSLASIAPEQADITGVWQCFLPSTMTICMNPRCNVMFIFYNNESNVHGFCIVNLHNYEWDVKNGKTFACPISLYSYPKHVTRHMFTKFHFEHKNYVEIYQIITFLQSNTLSRHDGIATRLITLISDHSNRTIANLQQSVFSIFWKKKTRTS